jgi:hypothetical protein
MRGQRDLLQLAGWAHEDAPSDELRRWFGQTAARRAAPDGPAVLASVPPLGVAGWRADRAQAQKDSLVAKPVQPRTSCSWRTAWAD